MIHLKEYIKGDSKFLHDFSNLQSITRREEFTKGTYPAELWKLLIQQADSFQASFWILYDGTQPVGRIGLSLPPESKSDSYFGFFEISPLYGEHATQLIDAVKKRSIKLGRSQLIGPINYNTWFSYRFKTSSINSNQQFSWEPVNPPEYPRYFLDSGFSSFQKYNTVITGNIQQFYNKTKEAKERVEKLGYSIRSFNMDHFLDQELPILYDISTKGFIDNFLYSPISYEQFSQIYTGGVKEIDFSYSAFALSPEGKEIGFFFVFPQENYIVMKSTTVVPEHRGKGISNAVLYPAFKRAIAEKKEGYISALMIKGAQSESYSSHGNFICSHEYELMKFSL